jgi:hypothetical protein
MAALAGADDSGALLMREDGGTARLYCDLARWSAGSRALGLRDEAGRPLLLGDGRGPLGSFAREQLVIELRPQEARG